MSVSPSPHAALADLLIRGLEPCLKDERVEVARSIIEETLAKVTVRREAAHCGKPKFYRGSMKPCRLVPGHPGQCQAVVV
jgi:hypothetical protein